MKHKINPDVKNVESLPPGGELRFVRRKLNECEPTCERPCRRVTHNREIRILQQYQYSHTLKAWDWYDVPLYCEGDGL